MTGLGQALRWLRERQARKQYRVADTAGITKGMLSAYETGRQRPSLESLEKLLATLGCDLNDLHNALQIVNGRPDRMSSWLAREPGSREAPLSSSTRGFGPGAEYPAIADPGAAAVAEVGATRRPPGRAVHGQEARGAGGEPSAVADLYRVLGYDTAGWAGGSLPAEEEAALGQMLEGFHGLLRYWHRSLETLRPPASGTAAAKAGEAGEQPGRARKLSDDH